MKKSFLFLIGGLFMSAAAMAQVTPGVDERQENQRDRLQQGVASGELTRKEAAHARADQRHIRKAERRAKADGVVTGQEKARLHHKQNKASRQLKRNKNDGQERGN